MRRLSWMLLPALLLLGAAAHAADDDDQEAIFDPEKTGPDYEIQGEYLGRDTFGNTWGVQVVALGDGAFTMRGYPNGLPGAGWDPDSGFKEAEGQTEDGRTRLQSDEGWYAETTDGQELLVYESGEVIVELSKQNRQSPTLGMEPPEGATVLFDGTAAEDFENGELILEDLLLANCTSAATFQDHTLHLEFRTPFKPHARGQQRGNSGMYIQGRYEVQILDSFGLDGLNNECGGIYSIAEPAVNMCFPPLTWQTYDYDFRAARYDDEGNKTENARVTIRHNGVVIHEDLELPEHTPGKLPEGPDAGPLYLQGHGNPVVFRNIWVVSE